MSGFRLVEAGVPGGGPLHVPMIYDDVDTARAVAEAIMEALVDRPHRRPFGYMVVDVETGEIVTRVRADSVHDPDPFPVVTSREQGHGSSEAVPSPSLLLWPDDLPPTSGPLPANNPTPDVGGGT